MGLKRDFVERASAQGANVSALCREFGISRPTGHKWIKRFKAEGHAGLEQQSRRPKSTPLCTAEDVVVAILEARDAHPTWGPKKINEVLSRKWGEQTPSESTIARILRRLGKVKARRKRPALSIVDQAPKVEASAANEVWSADFKGWWKTADGSRCEPLTVRDAYSRFLLASTIMATPQYERTRVVFEELFKKHGVPQAIQVDNGAPFISSNARAGLTKLSAWWIALGIAVVRSRPGCPQDNGAHERMHRDMRREVQAYAADTPAAQQRDLDKWRQEFNHIRPHQALGGKTPVQLYKPRNKRPLRMQVPVYPPDWLRRRVGARGNIRIEGETYLLGLGLAGYDVGLEPLDAFRYRGWFCGVDLGVLEVAPSPADLQRLSEEYRA